MNPYNFFIAILAATPLLCAADYDPEVVKTSLDENTNNGITWKATGDGYRGSFNNIMTATITPQSTTIVGQEKYSFILRQDHCMKIVSRLVIKPDEFANGAPDDLKNYSAFISQTAFSYSQHLYKPLAVDLERSTTFRGLRLHYTIKGPKPVNRVRKDITTCQIAAE